MIGWLTWREAEKEGVRAGWPAGLILVFTGIVQAQPGSLVVKNVAVVGASGAVGDG